MKLLPITNKEHLFTIINQSKINEFVAVDLENNYYYFNGFNILDIDIFKASTILKMEVAKLSELTKLYNSDNEKQHEKTLSPVIEKRQDEAKSKVVKD